MRAPSLASGMDAISGDDSPPERRTLEQGASEWRVRSRLLPVTMKVPPAADGTTIAETP